MFQIFKWRKRREEQPLIRSSPEVSEKADEYVKSGNPDFEDIRRRLDVEFPDAAEYQILTAIAKATKEEIENKLGSLYSGVERSLFPMTPEEELYLSAHSIDFTQKVWPLLRLIRSAYYEQQMLQNPTERVAQEVMDIWVDSFGAKPTSAEYLDNNDEWVLLSTPFRIETVVWAFKILYRENKSDPEMTQHLTIGIGYLPIRYGLDAPHRSKLADDWSAFISGLNR